MSALKRKENIMPKNNIKKEIIDKEIFMKVIKYKRTSIRKLGNDESIYCTERTIRRSLNERKMTPVILNQIAKHLDIDPRYLSGELHKQASLIEDEDFKEHMIKRLNPQNYPYFRKKQEDFKNIPINEFFERMFSLFDISLSQFTSLKIEKQFELQHDILDSIISVIKNYFFEDGYGQKGLPNIDRIVIDLENFIDSYYESIYTNTTLRESYAENPPNGKTKEEILLMSPEELTGLSLNDGNIFDKATKT
jgi:hypothetical protein